MCLNILIPAISRREEIIILNVERKPRVSRAENPRSSRDRNNGASSGGSPELESSYVRKWVLLLCRVVNASDYLRYA
jgi:hypothetical protein